MRYLVGTLLLIVAIVNARRILRWVGEGEAYLLVSAGGDGLFGRADRLDRPAAFWFNIAANALIVNGFAREVLKQLPMEFAVEAQKLLGISLEGSVG